jgi:uncharacterized membrane protein YfcA
MLEIDLPAALASNQSLDPMTGGVIIIATAIALGAIVLQFITLMRHDGRQAVVSSLTWVLLAGFAALMGALFYQTLQDFFLVLLMALLVAGATAGFVLHYIKSEQIRQIRFTRLVLDYPADDVEDVAARLRRKVHRARHRSAKRAQQ